MQVIYANQYAFSSQVDLRQGLDGRLPLLLHCTIAPSYPFCTVLSSRQDQFIVIDHLKVVGSSGNDHISPSF